ncbi:hypothetical protein DB30_01354 [Enhygromyxa salina]|uniref:Uncharacterized protein n=1 Tax=Enhygromyxa salina TaxID=215803 RepID=A0A0C2D9J2_9BACT|nr:hypothetical protein DB30_01354 [Enhygromyxa salina]
MAQPPAPVVEALEYGAAVEHLTATIERANRDPVESIDALTEAIAVFDGFAPQLSADVETLELREFARLSLARAQRIAGRPELAAEVMDTAIRASLGAELPADRLGPSVLALYQQRLAVLEAQGYATLEVSCEAPCRIFIEQREVASVPPLLLGRYDVWVADVAGRGEPLLEQVELGVAGEARQLAFGVTQIGGAALGQPQPADRRLMPRWASVMLLAAGTVAMAAGATVVTTAGKANDNPNLLAGAAALGGGAAAVITGGVVLSFDDHRARHGGGRQATLSWTLRF